MAAPAAPVAGIQFPKIHELIHDKNVSLSLRSYVKIDGEFETDLDAACAAVVPHVVLSDDDRQAIQAEHQEFLGAFQGLSFNAHDLLTEIASLGNEAEAIRKMNEAVVAAKNRINDARTLPPIKQDLERHIATLKQFAAATKLDVPALKDPEPEARVAPQALMNIVPISDTLKTELQTQLDASSKSLNDKYTVSLIPANQDNAKIKAKHLSIRDDDQDEVATVTSAGKTAEINLKGSKNYAKLAQIALIALRTLKIPANASIPIRATPDEFYIALQDTLSKAGYTNITKAEPKQEAPKMPSLGR